MNTCTRFRVVTGVLFALGSGCAPTLLVATVANPAKTSQTTTVSQTYEVGPYKENHRYELTLSDFSTSSVGFSAKLIDVDQCASPDSYTFTLVDDHDARAPLQPAAAPTVTKETGRANKTLVVATQAGTFSKGVTATTAFVVVQMRPVAGQSCPALDFRWSFQ